jgi:hypothetical protein
MMYITWGNTGISIPTPAVTFPKSVALYDVGPNLIKVMINIKKYVTCT